MSKKKYLSVNFNAKIKPVKPVNDEFTLCKCYVCAVGKNRNYSNITQKAIDDALPTLFNVPVFGHVYIGEDGEQHMGGHDFDIVQDKTGKYVKKWLTVPFGVLPIQHDVHYELIEEPDGNIKNYLVADVILWTGRYPELKDCIYNENLWFGQSMEIRVLDYKTNKEDKKYVDIDKFAFSGLCLLGCSDDNNYHVEPCFPESKVAPYKFEKTEEYTLLFDEFKEKLEVYFDKQKNENENEEEVENVDCEDLDIEEQENQEAETECQEDANEEKSSNEDNSGNEDTSEGTNENNEPKAKDGKVQEAVEDNEEESGFCLDFSKTYRDKFDSIYKALDGLAQSTSDFYVCYFLCDFDDDYAYVERFFASQEVPQGEMTKGRIKYSFDGEDAIVDATTFTKMFVKWLTAEEIQLIESRDQEYEILKAYKVENESKEFKLKLEAVAKEFVDLQDDAEYKNLLEKLMQFSDEESLREKLYAMRGKKVSVEVKPIKALIGNSTTVDEPYGGFIEEYSNKNYKKGRN